MEIRADISTQRPEIVILHKDKEFRFCARVLQRETFRQEGIDVFEPLNTFWKSLSPATIDKIFYIYSEVHRGFDQILSDDEIYYHLNNCIKDLLTLQPLNQIESWVSMDPGFIIPPEIMENFIADEGNKNSPDKTYLRKDYIELISLAVFMRILIPVFGEYIESTRREVGINFKEFHAVQLLTGTGILESHAVVKFLNYINLITKDNNQNVEAILNGSSTLDTDFYLLSLVLVRKLSISDIRGIGPKANLMSQIYNFLYPKIFNPPKTKVPIREKGFSNGDDSDPDNRSHLETYRKRTELSLADQAGIELGYENVMTNAVRLCPNITKEEVNCSIETSTTMLQHERVGDIQLVLMSWVFKTIHSPKSPYYIPKHLLDKNLGLLEAVLWHWGFEYLAMLASSHMIIGQEIMHVSSIDSRAQLSAQTISRINELFPYVWSNIGKTVSKAEVHPIVNAIDLFVDELVNNAWRATAHPDKLTKVFGEPRRKLPIIPTIKTELANLIIFIEEHAKANQRKTIQQI